MKRFSRVLVAFLLLVPAAAFAHRLDEYLEATILSVDTEHVEGSIRLVPGVAVSARVIATIDAGAVDEFALERQRDYAQRVLSDLLLKVDDEILVPRLLAASFPSPGAIRQGVGEIRLDFSAPRASSTPARTLRFENHHQPDLAVYLVNCTVPVDPHIKIARQVRNETQSVYEIEFAPPAGAVQAAGSRLGGFAAAFHLGERHIAAGTDHLMFLLTLLLPAPLLARSGRWRPGAGIATSVTRIVRIVTAFTLGHSLTLVVSALGLLSLPGRPVEVLIALSILVSALHALRPIFPGREARIAACFGLVHGLAFAAALGELGFAHAYLLSTLLGFNVGIEAMQLAVVAATLPSLLLLSRTAIYPMVRGAGAGLVLLAALGWIAERAFGLANPLALLLEQLALMAPWLAAGLLLFSFLAWSLERRTAATGLVTPPQ